MFSSAFSAEWKSKSEDCEKDVQEWQKKVSAATTNISKHNRQIKSKVCAVYIPLLSSSVDLHTPPKKNGGTEKYFASLNLRK